MNLNTPIEKITGIGPYYQKKLKRLGIKEIKDILFHFPHRYEDFSSLIPINQAKEGRVFSFQGEIVDIRNVRTLRKKMIITQAEISDNTGKLKVVWFNQPYLINNFKKGDYVCLSGKIVKKQSNKYLSNPVYEKINWKFGTEKNNLTHTGRLVPVYPETEGVSSKWLRYIIKPFLLKLKDKIFDPLPVEIIKKFKFLPLKEALWQIHFPDSVKLAQEAKKRFAFEELFILSLFILRERKKLEEKKAPVIPLNLNLMQEFIKKLPFTLTNAQKKALWQILKDLERPMPMNRLLEGDVGSGKTIVAIAVSLNVIKSGFQVAFMAPTEILAKQHFETANKFLNGFNTSLGLLTGKKKINREHDMVIGTHALIQEKIKFKNLGLVIIDEQHRFGVEQRAKLTTRGSKTEIIPHLLSMTATPIPRTLSLTIYGDLDLSLLDEMPKERKKVITRIITPQKREETYNFIRERIKKGEQAFVICPRIEPKAKNKENSTQQSINWLDVKAVKEEYEKLSKIIFPDLKIAMLHGKMKTFEKEEIMNNFKKGLIDILVSTSVVEVGVDVPNATIMMIEGAEKFGLAQLHQFRGRVGRSNKQSFCFLLTETSGLNVNRRLKALVALDNGFQLAEKDLQIRGPGDFIGQRQWGLPDLTMASLKDLTLVQKARNEAKEILNKDQSLINYPLLKEKLKEFKEKVHLE